jgi:ABC-2 type transport system ATP-binding protein
MRVREYLDFFGAAFKIPRRERAKRIDEVMEITNATYMRDRFVESLSHGMKQRVGIARTLLHDPQVLILDEPANGLDPKARIEMREILLRLAQHGKTLIVTSHILPELSRICDTVAIIDKGRMQAFGTLEQIMRNVRQRRVFEVQMFSDAQVAPMAALLRTLLEAGAEVTESPAESEVRFATDQDDRKLSELLAAAVQKGLQVVQYREVVMDLEDAFIEVTQRDPRGGTPPVKGTEAA